MIYLPLHLAIGVIFAVTALVAFMPGWWQTLAQRRPGLVTSLARKVVFAFDLELPSTRKRLRLASPLAVIATAVASFLVVRDLQTPVRWVPVSAPIPTFHVAELIAYGVALAIAVSIARSIAAELERARRRWFTALFVAGSICGVAAAHLHLDPRAAVPFYGAVICFVASLYVAWAGTRQNPKR